MLILQWGETPLYIASCWGHDKVVEVVIAAGSNVNLADKLSFCVLAQLIHNNQ